MATGRTSGSNGVAAAAGRGVNTVADYGGVGVGGTGNSCCAGAAAAAVAIVAAVGVGSYSRGSGAAYSAHGLVDHIGNSGYRAGVAGLDDGAVYTTAGSANGVAAAGSVAADRVGYAGAVAVGRHNAAEARGA